MDVDKAFRFAAKVEVTYISGILRASIEHEPNFLRLLFDGLVFAWIVWAQSGSWSTSSLISKIWMALVSIAALADLVYQLTGSEGIEFSVDGLRIRTKYFGWERTQHYPLEKCSELTWLPENNREHDRALECKVGWRKVRFGKYLTEAQAWDVLSELQRYLPEVAQKMGMSLGDRKSHILRLGLS